MAKHYAADDLLEQGVMAELDGRANPQLFRDAFTLFEETAKEMEAMEAMLDELIEIHKRGKAIPVFDESLAKLFTDMGPIERVTLHAGRFSNVSRGEPRRPVEPPRNLLELMEMQRVDLNILQKQLAETIETFRAVIPLAEKKQFVPMMLSGRAGFSSKVQQSVHLLGVYSASYSRGCMATIEATMQAYPAGFDWLPKVPDELGPAVPLQLAPGDGSSAVDAADGDAPAPERSKDEPATRSSDATPAAGQGGCTCEVGSSMDERGGGALLGIVIAGLGASARRRRRPHPTS